MPKRSQIAVLSTGQPLLASLLFRALNLNDFPASIASTGRTNMVRQLRAMALRAIVQRRGSQLKMTASLALTRLSIFSLW